MQRLHDDGEAAPPMHSLPVFEDLFPSHAEKLQAKAVAPFRAWDAGQAMFIMHSSGMHTSWLSVGSGLTSTRTRVNYVSQTYCLDCTKSTRMGTHDQYVRHRRQPIILRNFSTAYGDVDFNGLTMACHACPMFHAMGVMHIGGVVRRPSYLRVHNDITPLQGVAGYTMGVFRPCRPAVFPTAENVLEGAQTTGSDIIFTIPAFVEVRKIQVLRTKVSSFLEEMGIRSIYRAETSNFQGSCTSFRL